MFLLFYRYYFFSRSHCLWLAPLYKSDPPPNPPPQVGDFGR